jgi:hypothetical protein
VRSETWPEEESVQQQSFGAVKTTTEVRFSGKEDDLSSSQALAGSICRSGPTLTPFGPEQPGEAQLSLVRESGRGLNGTFCQIRMGTVDNRRNGAPRAECQPVFFVQLHTEDRSPGHEEAHSGIFIGKLFVTKALR